MGRQVVTLNQSMTSQELSHTSVLNVFSIVGATSQAILASFVTIIEL